MKREEFVRFRKKMKRTQVQMAHLLGLSIKAVHSYEQGWRGIPSHVERQLLYLASRLGGGVYGQTPCWVVKKCPEERRRNCPAWEFNAGEACWFIGGTHCCGTAHKSWKEKMKVCRQCDMLKPVLQVQTT